MTQTPHLEPVDIDAGPAPALAGAGSPTVPLEPSASIAEVFDGGAAPAEDPAGDHAAATFGPATVGEAAAAIDGGAAPADLGPLAAAGPDGHGDEPVDAGVAPTAG
ncbi:hypothetical protein [Nakamurella sp.]|uniref:hypothetical protein n=1 Tax=Nakamurella sp. TaxID=1869182 RepID=UPI0037848A89